MPKTYTWVVVTVAISSIAVGAVIVRQRDSSSLNRSSQALLGTPEQQALARQAFADMLEADRLPRTKANVPRILDLYRHSLKVSPNPLLQLRFARLLAQSGRSEEARRVYGSLLTDIRSGRVGISTNDPGLALGVADDMGHLGMAKDAEAMVDGFAREPLYQVDARFKIPELDQNPAHARANALFSAGIGQLRIHSQHDAVETFRQVTTLRPDWGWGRFMLAYAYEYAGERDKAELHYAKAAQLGLKRPARMLPLKRAPLPKAPSSSPPHS